MFGRVLDIAGRPVANALLDIWQANSEGFYDWRLENPEKLRMRGYFPLTGAGGQLLVQDDPAGALPHSDGRPGRAHAAGQQTVIRTARRTSTSWCRRTASSR